MSSPVSEIINNLTPQRIWRRRQSPFEETCPEYVCLGAKLTERSKAPGRYEFQGWYRLFNRDDCGDPECLRSNPLIAVESETEARLQMLALALSYGLLPICDGVISEVGCAPIALHVISANDDFLQSLPKVMSAEPDDSRWRAEANAHRALSRFDSLYSCQTDKQVVKQIYKLKPPTRIDSW